MSISFPSSAKVPPDEGFNVVDILCLSMYRSTWNTFPGIHRIMSFAIPSFVMNSPSFAVALISNNTSCTPALWSHLVNAIITSQLTDRKWHSSTTMT
eukprot:1730661-Amphidinium_carterae.2